MTADLGGIFLLFASFISLTRYDFYVLQSRKDNRFYTGWSNDLRKRLQEHNAGKVFSTASRRPVRIIYYEACENREDAKKRERYLKTTWGKR